MKVYQRMARAFRAEGITHTFGIMGDGNMYWLNEMIKLGSIDVEVRHEGAVVSGRFEVLMHSLSGKSSNPPERSAGTNYRWTSDCLSCSYHWH